MELKNTAWELGKVCTSFSSQINQAEERISEIKNQLNEIKWEGKLRGKRNEQSLQEISDYVKRPNLHLIGVPECDGENESKLENPLQYIQENFPNLASQASVQVQEIQRIPQRYSSRRATPRHIIIRFNRVEMKKKNAKVSQRKGRLPTKGSQSDLQWISQQKPYKPEDSGGPIFNNLKEKNFQPRISYPAKLSFISRGEIKSFMDSNCWEISSPSGLP